MRVLLIAICAIATGRTQPLILTPLIEAGRFDDARKAAQVHDDVFLGVDSYSGFLTVDKKADSHLFFWFFPATHDYDAAPVILWLQGGPASPSTFGLFIENGPFRVTSNLDLQSREHAWNRNHSVIYIDNPVGTGYSFTGTNGYCRNQTEIGENLHAALVQFFRIFAELRSNPFYAMGQSYAGKYVPAVSYTIHRKNNDESSEKINLKGLAIGNGLIDPVNQLGYSEYLHQLGVIDAATKVKMTEMQNECGRLIREEKWTRAYWIFNNLVMGDTLNHHFSVFKNVTGFKNNYNYLFAEDPFGQDFVSFLELDQVRRALHVGNSSFQPRNPAVKINLIDDFMQSVSAWLLELDFYKVLLYSGQLDVVVAYPLTVNFLEKLEYDEYKTSRRRKWYVDGDLAGYWKTAGNLTEVLIRNAGHLAPADQPKWCAAMITEFTH